MSCIENWDNFTRYHGGIVGARDCFELLCEDLLRHENNSKEIHRVKATHGDGGIDIYVSNGTETDIYQCKFFLDKLNSSQWSQIQSSFSTILKHREIHIHNWYLVVPKEFDKDDIVKIEKFKQKNNNDIHIKFIDGNEIISRLKAVGIAEKWFEEVDKSWILNSTPKLIPEYVDRDYITKIIDTIKIGQKHCLITGVGGIGKTTVLEKIFYSLNNLFDCAFWIDYQDTIQNSLVQSMNVDDSSHILNELLQYLGQKRGQRNIVFIDNVNEHYFSDPSRFLIEKHAICIVSSRIDNIAGYNRFSIDSFDNSGILQIFKNYYQNPMSSDDESRLIQYITKFDGNTLLVELLGRAAKKSNLTLKDFIEKLKSSGIASSRIKIQNSRTHIYDNISKQLALLYEIDNLSEEEKRLVVCFTYSKSLWVDNSFIQILQADEEALSDLVEFGWIKKYENSFSMHPLICEAIVNQIDDRRSYSECLLSFYSNPSFFYDEISVKHKQMHVLIMIDVIFYNKAERVRDVYIIDNFLKLVEAVAKDVNQEYVYKIIDTLVKEAELRCVNLEPQKEAMKVLISIYNTAGLAQHTYRNNEAAISYFTKEKNCLEKYFPEYRGNICACIENMALVYSDYDYSKASKLFHEVIDEEINLFGTKSIRLADSYHNIGRNHYLHNNYTEAVENFEKAYFLKLELCPDTQSLSKTELSLANALTCSIQSPISQEKYDFIKQLYISVLERYEKYQNGTMDEIYFVLESIKKFTIKFDDLDTQQILDDLLNKMSGQIQEKREELSKIVYTV